MGAVRLFLAFGVVFSHTCDQVLTQLGLPADALWFFNILGGRSVIFFYVVSGFLMSYVLEMKYAETTKGRLAFFRSRALRIFPLWWAILFFGAFLGTNSWLSQHSPLLLIPPTLLIGTDWIVPFWHYPDWYWDNFPHAAGVGWTLGAEFTFYLMAPWVLRSTRLTLTLFAVSAMIRGAVFYLVGPGGAHYIQWSYYFFPATLMFFSQGILRD